MLRRSVLALPVLASISSLAGCGDPPTTNASAEPAGSGSGPTPGGKMSAAAPGAGDMPAPDDVAKPPADAEKTESGIFHKQLQKGTGTEHPGPTDKVKVHYSGWTTDGKNFDNSYKRKAPASFALNGVIKGWTEGVQLMVVGEKRRFWIPGPLAYGDTAKGGRPAGQLTFDIELLEIQKGAPPPPKVEPIPAPEDVKDPPKDAKKTKSGLVYKSIKKGTGTKKPGEKSKVSCNYTGWTPGDGKMFDSSIPGGKPVEFGVDQVIKGWTEGLQLMVEGETMRFWIPADLAYGEKPPRGYPAGALTFDVELVKILPADGAAPAASGSAAPAAGSAAPKASAAPAGSAKPKQ